MTRTEELFLALYRDAVNHSVKDEALQKELSALTQKDWRKILQLADIHAVFPMVYQSIWDIYEGDVPESVRAFSFKAKKQTCMQAQRSAEFLSLYQFLILRGLHPVVVKGMICRDLYPEPEQRASTDEDLYISSELFGEYHNAFLSYGMKLFDLNSDIEHDSEVPYVKDHLYIELHKQLFPPESKAYGNLNQYFQDPREITETMYDIPIRTMDHTHHLFYLICHAYKHFLNAGTGLRMVSDIVLYSMKFIDQINWSIVVQNCTEINAREFTSTLYLIGEKWLFPTAFPGKLKEIWQTETVKEEAMLEDILAGGIYGTSSENRLHSTNLTLGAAESTGNTVVHTLFPSFSYMKGKYQYLKNYPVLLPFAWIQRIGSYGIGTITGKKKDNTVSGAVRVGNERVELLYQYNMIEKKPSLVKRIYHSSQTSVFAPVLSPLFAGLSTLQYFYLDSKEYMQGNRKPSKKEAQLVVNNVTFILKSFERQGMAKGLCRNINTYYPGVQIIVADDSKTPLQINIPNVQVIHLPFNSGISAGLNAALNEVKTPYVLRLDDDELLTLASKVHTELAYLMNHPQIDLIGFGYTTVPKLHKPSFYMQEYYDCPMADTPERLKIPHRTVLDENHVVLGKVANIWLARTEAVKSVGYDPQIRVIDHHDFFWRAAGYITSAAALDTIVFHRHNPYNRRYNTYRSDIQKDLVYIRQKHRMLLKEKQNDNKEA